MAENVPPATSTPGGASATVTTGPGGGAEQNATNRGLPYYEKLRRDLRDTLQKKRLMDKSMAQLEDQIYRFEQSYLEETTAGNIIKGFDNYIKGSSGGSNLGASGLAITGGGGAGVAARRKSAVSDQDRVFSRSSASFMRDSPAPSSAQTTLSHAPTPTSSHNGPTNGSGNNKSGNDGPASASASVKSGSTASKNKKKSSGGGSAARDSSNKDKDKNNDDDGDGGGEDGSKPPAKRLKISYGRD
ncbi:conserved hypothetical protein [Paecilomyces variotii No. 5]|uniref:Chromatin modification-related protein EAF6 n=1 Tax=Byssochlamys spectabilis (strain No. 5 / NBRC 109023) TaxID=1356009 RepID=V5GEV9_BYSSN|nr:conserved hypothetical protein [Paecilomyces variotii No. 5]